jgi:hypothetical protein
VIHSLCLMQSMFVDVWSMQTCMLPLLVYHYLERLVSPPVHAEASQPGIIDQCVCCTIPQVVDVSTVFG